MDRRPSEITRSQRGQIPPQPLKGSSEPKNLSACEQCREAKLRCKVATQHRFNECERCSALGPAEGGLPRPVCSYSKQSLCFFAADFTFKHAPSPYGFEKDVEYQPAPEGYDEEKDELKYRMQYFYVEKPYESKSAWSPVYVRTQLQDDGISPFELTPLMISRSEVPELSSNSSDIVDSAWERFRTSTLIPAERPKFAVGETVLTCRRICSLYGYLDLEHPKPDTFKVKSWSPGFYEVIWRVQFFDIRENRPDRWVIRDRTLDLANSSVAVDGGYKNPMRFPHWDGEDDTSYPNRPLLRFSVGYGKLPRRVAEYDLDYSLGHVSIADQVLLGSNEHLRVDHLVSSKEYWENTSSGWMNIKSEGSFEIVRGRPPIFVVSNIDTGDWQGGFRFGGVELRLLK